jgi:hypothetical protein
VSFDKTEEQMESDLKLKTWCLLVDLLVRHESFRIGMVVWRERCGLDQYHGILP